MKLKKISKCRICGGKIKNIIDLNNQPPANSLHKKLKKEKEIRLNLVLCRSCFTAQLDTTVDPDYLFKNYFWVTGTSKKALEHARNFFLYAKNKIKKKNFSVLEIASNDGTFLQPFRANGCKVLGVDPAKNLNKKIKKIKTITAFFNYKISKEIKLKYSYFDFIFARNVIPHNDNVKSIIKGFANLMSNTGIGAIEFHYAGTILKEKHYDSIYHEHIYYFTIKTLENILKKYKLNIFDCQTSPISGGSLIIYFSKILKKPTPFFLQLKKNEIKNKYNSLKRWQSFGLQSIKHANNFKKTLKKIINKNNKKIVAYGASARSSTLLNFCKIGNETISHIVDKNKLKHNFFTPGTNIKIKSFEQDKINFKKYKYILILAWNFKNEIINDLKKYNFTGKIISPLPIISVKKCL